RKQANIETTLASPPSRLVRLQNTQHISGFEREFALATLIIKETRNCPLFRRFGSWRESLSHTRLWKSTDYSVQPAEPPTTGMLLEQFDDIIFPKRQFRNFRVADVI